MCAPVDEITVEDLVRDPYDVYRRLRDAGSCVWLAPARRYVLPRWEEVFALDEDPAFTAAEPDSLMTRAMGLSMLRTDGEAHQRQRRAAHRVLPAKEFEACWSGMLAGVADELLDEIGRPAAPISLGTLRVPMRRARSSGCSVSMTSQTPTCRSGRRR
jgi:cytochrome P450